MDYLLLPNEKVSPKSKAVDEVAGRGWIAIHAFMTQIPRTEAGLRELHALLASELNGAKREVIVYRVYRAFNALRMELEEQSLYA